jgi:transposase
VIPAGVRIFVCTAPVDLRHGFDRLAQAARERVGMDPMSGGALFVFANRRATRLKVLWLERNGFCLLYKRLHDAMFELPAAGAGSSAVHVDGAALARLLAGVPKPSARQKESHDITRRLTQIMRAGIRAIRDRGGVRGATASDRSSPSRSRARARRVQETRGLAAGASGAPQTWLAGSKS